MHTPSVVSQSLDGGFVSLAGIHVRSILSAELFRETAGLPHTASAGDISAQCHDRWVELANTLAALPDPAETLFFIGTATRPGRRKGAFVAFLALGHGRDETEARERALVTWGNLWTPLVTTLDYLELEPIRDDARLHAIMEHVSEGAVLEIRRRRESLQLTHGRFERRPAGFNAAPDLRETAPTAGEPGTAHGTDDLEGADDTQLVHLFPWVPSDDPWRRLVEALLAEDEPAALAIRIRGLEAAPAVERLAARAALAGAEKLVGRRVDQRRRVDEVLHRQAEALREAGLWRLAILEGRVVAGRVFLVSRRPPSAGLVAITEAAVDDASVRPGQSGTESMFRGGATRAAVSSSELLAPLDTPGADVLFGPLEASAIVRTPMPMEVELPGLRVNRARTARLLGVAGDDCPIGTNVHRGQRSPVALDEAARFRHTYVVGQTGTGKSTLLLHMILHDIVRGRGVAVLDPHGSLIDDVLLRLPPERADDVVIVDVTDTERPVGFNVLRIHEPDPVAYGRARDLVIDDLYAYLDRAYDLKQVGGPIFETHFRGMLALLLGSEPPVPPRIPNLMVFRALYTNDRLRAALSKSAKGKDVVLDDFIREAQATGGDLSLRNIAPYITSKFNRFVSDHALRNITCQHDSLDLDAIVADGRILLFHLGKGRFGDQAAGLLASQIVSRIRQTVMRRGAATDAPPFFLYADEFQLFADERFAELLAEARKFRLSLTLAHQFVEQLPEQTLRAVLGNVGTTVALRVGARDGEALEPIFWPTFRRRDLSSLPNFAAYVRSFGALGLAPFSVELSPSPSPGDPSGAAAVRERSRQRYGRPREVVEKEIRATYEAYRGEDE